jgi:hypothetical protein
MKSSKKCLALLMTLALIVPGTARADIVDDFGQALDQIQTDTARLSRWTADQLRNAIPFNATSGNVVPKQLKLLGFELGIEGMVSGTHMDIDGLKRIGTTIIDTNEIDAFDRLPFPLVLAHANVGLPFGLMGGIRFGGIPKTVISDEDTRGEFKNTVLGFDVRKRILDEGAAKPFGLTVGLNFTRASGSIDLRGGLDSIQTTHRFGVTDYMTTLDAIGTAHTKWDVNSWGLQAVMNKQILFMNPYLGASVNRNFGTVSTSFTTDGTLEIADGINPSYQNTATRTGVGSADVNPWDLRAMLGIEFSVLPFLRLGIHGEYAGSKNIAGGLGLRAQFGGLKS